jgi:hypothetical protein
VLTPVQAPNANAHPERWIRTVRAECLDWLLIVGRGTSSRSFGSTSSTTTPIAHTGRSGCSRRIQPSNQPLPARIIRPKYTGVTCSADSYTSTDELHERICAPYAQHMGPIVGSDPALRPADRRLDRRLDRRAAHLRPPVVQSAAGPLGSQPAVTAAPWDVGVTFEEDA